MSEKIEKIKKIILDEGLDVDEFLAIATVDTYSCTATNCTQCRVGCSEGCKEGCTSNVKQS